LIELLADPLPTSPPAAPQADSLLPHGLDLLLLLSVELLFLLLGRFAFLEFSPPHVHNHSYQGGEVGVERDSPLPATSRTTHRKS
jgi:hypothetical protein